MIAAFVKRCSYCNHSTEFHPDFGKCVAYTGHPTIMVNYPCLCLRWNDDTVPGQTGRQVPV